MGWTDFWTEDEDNKLRSHYRHYDTWEQIAEGFPDRPIKGVKARAVRLGLTKGRRQLYLSPYKVQPVLSVTVPPDVWDERDRRANEYRTPAQVMMGDPPFSQSALGRRPD